MIVDTIHNLVTNPTPQTAILAIPAALLLYHVIPWLLDSKSARKYPGPFFAKFSDFWLASTSFGGRRSEIIHDYHLKYGKSAHPLHSMHWQS
jgi:benzoate 4-monooxygenase